MPNSVKIKAFKVFLLLFVSMSVAQSELPSGIAKAGNNSGTLNPAVNSFITVSGEILTKRISITMRDVKIKAILERLEILTGATFIYENELIDIGDHSISAEEEELQSILNELLYPHEIGYTVINRASIVLASFNSLQKNTGGIIGRVINENNEPLVCANVYISRNKYGCATDFEGHFELLNLEPGQYKIKVSFVGYKTQEQTVTVVAGKKIEINFKLEPESFQIGGIQVIGTSELIPLDVNTKTVINSGEIEHYQATSLGDVLDLVPGIQKTTNPGLNRTSQVTIRGDVDDPLSAFGTKIIIDGIPQSNNANLQFESLTGAKFGGGTIGRGTDLRAIPADNIETINVLSGLPSVRYGDFTAGVIEITTKIGAQPNRLKVKTNPHTSEANLGGGYKIGSLNSLSYNFNFARSERDIRLTGDEYSRYTGQLVFSTLGGEGNYSSNYKLNGQYIADEEEPKGDYSQTKNYNRGFNLGITTWGQYNIEGNVSNIEYNAYVRMNRINSRKSKLVQSDLRVLPSGDTVAAYTGVVENKGIEWTAGGRFDFNKIYFTGTYIHKVLFGFDAEFDDNTGEGKIVDSVYNYYGPDSPLRTRSFDDIPGQLLLSLYAEDKITGHLGVDFSLMLGLRYEMYRPYAFNLKGLWGDGNLVESHQGTFFNPRLSLMLFLSESNQIRFSAGRTSKSPPMSRIYPDVNVSKWRNPADSTIYYFVQDRTVPDLKGFQETHIEASFDQKIGSNLGATISAYYKERKGQPVGLPVPLFYESNVNGVTQIFYIDQYSIDTNIGKYFTRGIELSFRTGRIDPLNMTFSVIGSYIYTDNPGSGFSYSSTPDESKGQYPNYKVPDASIDTLLGWTYPSSGRWQDNIQINYYLRYTHPILGLWVTLRVEQLVKERYQNYDLVPMDYDMLTESGQVTRQFDESMKTKPNKWLFNLSVSKSLFAGAEVSFYVNNFMDDPAIRRYYSSPTQISEEARNPELFYGIEFSMIFDTILR